MARMGGDKRLKRSGAPTFWGIPRKRYQFAVLAAPGPHPRNTSYPLTVLLRDTLGVVKSAREARVALGEGSIIVDGVVRREPDFPVGLMDVLEIPSIGKVYRLVPTARSLLSPVEIPDSEKSLKLCKIRRKVTIKKGRLQYGMHDGRSIITEGEVSLNVGDSLLIQVPSQKIERTLKFEKGALALVISGQKAGQLGRIEDIKAGTFSRPPIATLKTDGDSTELPTALFMIVGKDKPLLTLGGVAA